MKILKLYENNYLISKSNFYKFKQIKKKKKNIKFLNNIS